MKDIIKLRILQGDPIVHDVKNANLFPLFRGRPVLDDRKCPDGCKKCVEACPVGARKFGNLLDPNSEIRYILENIVDHHQRIGI